MSTLMLMLLSGDVSVDPGPMAGPIGGATMYTMPILL